MCEKTLVFHNDEQDTVTCYCGDTMPRTCLEKIYDDQNCYAGLACTYQCYEDNGPLNLHYSPQNVLENGEILEDY